MTVTRYSWDDDSAPQIDSSAAGKLVAVLDACLVDGYGSQAAAGWTKEFTDTNKAVYRPPVGNRCYLEVDNTTTNKAVVQAYATMSAFATGTEAFSNSTNKYWVYYHNSVVNQWQVVASDRSFYLICTRADDLDWAIIYFFGDYIAANPDFQYNTMLFHTNNATVTSFASHWYFIQFGVETYTFLRRGHDEIDTTAQAMFKSLGTSYMGNHTYNGFPDYQTGGLTLDRVHMRQNSGYIGVMPGLFDPLCTVAQGQVSTISGSEALAGRDLLLQPSYTTSANVVIDITGPWY